MEAVTEILVARSHEPQGLRKMVVWSLIGHLALAALALYMPDTWWGHTEEAPRTVMTISLGGAPGPRAGGMTQLGGRPVQAPEPIPTRPRAVTPPAAKAPEMVLPSRNVRVRPRPAQAPPDASGRTPTTGPEPQEGSARAETGARGQGFGLTTGGGGGTGVQLDVGDFCCPEYLEQMVALIQRNWQAKQGIGGTTVMQFTVTRAGAIERVQVERPSGFVALDLAAQRALLLTRLPELPAAFPNPNLTVHMRFEYQS
jgi:TonB family protein